VEYPSFENRCWSSETPVGILLTDQATLCLCPAYRQCPRFGAARATRQGHTAAATPPPPDADALSQALNELEADVHAAGVAQTRSRRRWGWIGAGLIFVSSLLCGGFFAAYVGWQMVSTELAASPPGNVNTLAPAPAVAAPQLFMIVTATSAPQSNPIIAANPPAPGADPAANPGAATNLYPQAVAPTLVPPGGVLNLNAPPPSFADIAQTANPPAPPALAAATPIPELALTIPTRRPTPILDIPTSTGVAPEALPTLPPVPTAAPLGTPWVVFAAEETALEEGDCTTVAWHVENVSAVFYENLGVDGKGEKKECMKDDPGNYSLLVVLPDGSSRAYTVTVGLIRPTETPRPTPTFTEEPLPTPTWTPNIPTATPTPPTNYSARLEAGGDTEFTCAKGDTCEVDLYVTNAGDGVDTLSLRFTEASSWPYQLCRLDGVCSTQGMSLVNMSPSSTGVIRLRISVPADALPDTLTYRLQAVSEQSGGVSLSDTITIRVTTDETESP
jgi:hypothetical protein